MKVSLRYFYQIQFLGDFLTKAESGSLVDRPPVPIYLTWDHNVSDHSTPLIKPPFTIWFYCQQILPFCSTVSANNFTPLPDWPRICNCLPKNQYCKMPLDFPPKAFMMSVGGATLWGMRSEEWGVRSAEWGVRSEEWGGLSSRDGSSLILRGEILPLTDLKEHKLSWKFNK